ncbi:MAG: YifB family Mg chelatase-like AAA ATPase [Propionibacteriaceae bacterium]|nr:YifB family Mg chelatase-like AAA ATPase [Propionibacteriaceae bacterium]
MNPAQAWSVALIGLQGVLVEVEVHVGSGLPKTVIVGLPDSALMEAKDRCRAAMSSCRFGWPSDPVTINLSPAALPKAGSHYDLSIAAAMGAVKKLCSREALADCVIFGELSLDGRVRPIRGLLPALLCVQQHGFAKVIVPTAQLREAALVKGLSVTGVTDLSELFDVLRGGAGGTPPAVIETQTDGGRTLDLADVVGQVEAKWALEVAAAGRHHLFLHGPPGVGKTLLAERLPGVLPDLTESEALEVSAIHSLVGKQVDSLITRPPYANPHHSATIPALVGGGSRIATPGAISMAHRGVLFLDEAPEFAPKALEALRVPLESGRAVIARAAATTVFPASFQLVLAANPCPCGLAATPGAACSCTSQSVRRYAERISGPILDRVDMHQQLRPLKAFMREKANTQESSVAVAERVLQARNRQVDRLREFGFRTNAEVAGALIRKKLPLPEGIEKLENAVRMGRLSARGVDKTLRISWTIADLAQAPKPTAEHLDIALAMRSGQER